MNHFSIKTELINSKLVIETFGYLNNDGGEIIAKECYKHIESGIKTIILDLKETKVVNSMGISVLIEIIDNLNQVNGKLVFINLDAAIEKTFSIMGLFQFSLKANTLQEALSNP